MMFRSLLIMLLLFMSAHAIAYKERLNLQDYPSTYLRDCQGVAYVYQADRASLMLGIRAVKNCARIKINNKIYKMEKYALGFRFESKIRKSSVTQVTLFSKKGSRDHFIIENMNHKRRDRNSYKDNGHEDRHSHRQTDRHATKTKRALAALKICDEYFGHGNVQEHCHDTMKRSRFAIEPIARFCAKGHGVRGQQRCLDDSLRFSYDPVSTMQSCKQVFPIPSTYQRCIDASTEYDTPPSAIISQCNNIFNQSTERLNCIDRLSQSKYPDRQLAILSQCADQFFPSQIEQCYQQANNVKRRRSQTLDACAKSFIQPSDKLHCLSMSASITGAAADAVVQQCAQSHMHTRKKLSCIEEFST